MARGRGESSSRLRGARGRGRGGFRSSRLEETQDNSDALDGESEVSDASPGLTEDEFVEDDSISDDGQRTNSSYQVLLQALKAKQEMSEPAEKKRKISNGDGEWKSKFRTDNSEVDQVIVKSSRSNLRVASLNQQDETDVGEEENDQANDEASQASSDDETKMDSFDHHFAKVEESFLSSQINTVESKKWHSIQANVPDNVRKVTTKPSSGYHTDSTQRKKLRTFKNRLSGAGTEVNRSLIGSENDLASSIFDYDDILFGSRSIENSPRTRDLVSLHALNHVFKTRDRVIKNNSRLAQELDNGYLDIRDQGFTRPKILVLLPTRQACVQWVETIVRLSQPDQQENKARFMDNYSAADQQVWDEKPEDFRALFAGNIDDDFRIGLKFTRKTIKFFSSFYNSDIILASGLGLMRAIEGADSKDNKKSHDADFLSSIEIAVIDHANAILMQNWQHVDYVFSQLNLLPKESHGCDFSRVRTWYLDGNAKYLRQTIILSDYLTPDINSLASAHFHNIAGKTKYTPTYQGAIINLPPSISSGTLTQTFTRFTSLTPAADHDARFTHFTTTILPTLLRHSSSAKGTLVFIPDYASFLRLRNHLSTSLDTTSLSFAAVSEFSSHRDVARARSHFLSGRHSVLLYTERAHHFRRFRLRGVKKVIFYGVPENPRFWGEIVGFVGLDSAVTGESKAGKRVVRALFSKWDVMKLERIVGTERVGRLVAEGRGGDMFDFV